ncbi:hypothetical protein K438DRAFT_1964647 [Mycena galopus ATCC 62051]|nr:hypothetical protein K438DRAFT_1964647 [Mycena galopus ATCC 62051]
MSAPKTPSAPPTPAADDANASWRVPAQKVVSYIRFKTQPNKRPPIIFPPPSWSLEETQNNGAGASAIPDEPGIPKNISEDEVQGEEAPEPHQFAQRIGTLIDSLPLPAPTKDSDIGAVDAKGPPLPLSVTGDSKLMKLLSSENVMNGSLAAGRQSVWTMLERLKHGHAALVGNDKGDESKKDEREDHGVMMYGPLEPTADSQVEIADSELVLEYFDEPSEADKLAPVDRPASADEPAKPPPSPQPEGRKSGGVTPSKSRSNLKRKEKERVHWMPSPTKISLQAMWWGYRLYFPSSVMALLDDTHLEAARRDTAMLFPPNMRPAILVLKRLTPYLGYVGVFIAWSWTAIKARDKGHGVVLSATWLLPVALVPATLRLEDFQRPGAVDAAKAGKPTDPSLNSSATSAPTADKAETKKSSGSAPVKSTEPGLKPNASSKADNSKAPTTEAEKESLSRRWSTLILGRDKPQGKAAPGK